MPFMMKWVLLLGVQMSNPVALFKQTAQRYSFPHAKRYTTLIGKSRADS
jgi:hypothetical protein